MSDSKPDRPLRAKAVDYVVIGVIALLVGYAVFMTSASNPTSKLVGQPAPAFKLKSASGAVFGPETHRGKVVILDFWATWCQPCRKQMPALAALEKDPEYADKVVVLSVNTDDPSAERGELVDTFLEENGWEFDVLYDNGFVSRQYSVTRIPTIVVISPKGNVTYADSGVLDRGDLEDLVEKAQDADPSS